MGSFIDMTGERHGLWTVVRFARADSNSGSMWLCRCGCGIEREVARKSLIRGASLSCGCVRSPDLAGMRFGRLLALEKAGTRQNSNSWAVVCDCGQRTEVTFANLVNGSTQSCGCLHREAARSRRLKHGHADQEKSLTYNSWRGMIERCYRQDHVAFEHYGARGISVCTAWRTDFAAFLRDMGERPEGRSLDRIDNDKGYEPGNCRWATGSEQRANQRPARPRQPRHDLTGRRFGSLVVGEFAGMAPRAMWRCQCDCGAKKLAAAKTLLNGGTRSCGHRLHRSDLALLR